ncbi:hypothetical protein GE107_25175 [Cohnella sp. CFH 77786]|uniref:hypothetical protein n=1 Tax=Cohnella sp. CFH 77786 TaxID=2662265 RepID=UPI001C60B58D|nr:hypothetical protein [Cohnella sp. CFH 77786]MBW5449323.1 hypothetical protein [Cohnella sp. CFH 77786]
MEQDESLYDKRWTIYTTKQLYKAFKYSATISDTGIMLMANEALAMYHAIFPEIKKLHNEAAEHGLELHDYIKKIITSRNPDQLKSPEE